MQQKALVLWRSLWKVLVLMGGGQGSVWETQGSLRDDQYGNQALINNEDSGKRTEKRVRVCSGGCDTVCNAHVPLGSTLLSDHTIWKATGDGLGGGLLRLGG